MQGGPVFLCQVYTRPASDPALLWWSWNSDPPASVPGVLPPLFPILLAPDIPPVPVNRPAVRPRLSPCPALCREPSLAPVGNVSLSLAVCVIEESPPPAHCTSNTVVDLNLVSHRVPVRTLASGTFDSGVNEPDLEFKMQLKKQTIGVMNCIQLIVFIA